MKKWKSWEKETKTIEYQYANGMLAINYLIAIEFLLAVISKGNKSKTQSIKKLNIGRIKYFRGCLTLATYIIKLVYLIDKLFFIELNNRTCQWNIPMTQLLLFDS